MIMVSKSTRVAIVVPNWNGEDLIKSCIDSLLLQKEYISIIVVENGSTDKSIDILSSYGKQITVLAQELNLGFAGGVNVGIKHALDLGFEYVGLFNNDALAEPTWASSLKKELEKSKDTGIVTSKILIGKTGKIDSTGDWYTSTGMPFPRGRNEVDTGQYDSETVIFGASGGASLYRSSMLKEIGLFDEDFFAYYEDVDISFRAQLYGWKVSYVPSAVVYHQLSATSSKHGYFAIRQSAKNFWFLYIKNLPAPLFFKYLPAASYRFSRMLAARLIKGGFWAFLNGWLHGIILFPKKLIERRDIQKNRKVSVEYIESIIFKGKPPVAKS